MMNQRWVTLGQREGAHQNPVVRGPISSNPGLNFNPGFSILFFKGLFQIIPSILFRTCRHQIIDKKIILNSLLKLSDL